MADISKCSLSEECILKEKCFRSTASISEFNQSWLEGQPVKNKTDKCSFYYGLQKVYDKRIDCIRVDENI